MTNTTPHPLNFKLYVITDRMRCVPRPLYDVLHELLDAGIDAIQLREKDLSDAEFIKLAEPIAKLCRTYSAQLFINSRVQIALNLEVDGVHLPANAALEKSMKASLMIGCSAHTLDEAINQEREGADFVTYSPIFLTASKPGYGPAVGVDNLRRVVETVEIPVFALGGITPERVEECLIAGARGVAVMSGLMLPENGVHQAKAYLTQVSTYR